MNKPVTVRRALAEEYKTIAAIGKATFYETWRSMNTEEDMQSYMAEAFNEQKIKADLEDAGNIFLLAEVDGKPIGYAKLRADRNYDEFKDSTAIEMERIYVYKEYHKKKAGKALMDESIRIAKEQNNDWLWLGVYTGNFKAISFYEQYGFVVFGKKVFKLGNAEDCDFLMKLDLKTVK